MSRLLIPLIFSFEAIILATHLIVSSKITKVKPGIQSKSELYPVRLHVFDIAMSAAKLPNKCERATVLSSDRAKI